MSTTISPSGVIVSSNKTVQKKVEQFLDTSLTESKLSKLKVSYLTSSKSHFYSPKQAQKIFSQGFTMNAFGDMVDNSLPPRPQGTAVKDTLKTFFQTGDTSSQDKVVSNSGYSPVGVSQGNQNDSAAVKGDVKFFQHNITNTGKVDENFSVSNSNPLLDVSKKLDRRTYILGAVVSLLSLSTLSNIVFNSLNNGSKNTTSLTTDEVTKEVEKKLSTLLSDEKYLKSLFEANYKDSTGKNTSFIDAVVAKLLSDTATDKNSKTLVTLLLPSLLEKLTSEKLFLTGTTKQTLIEKIIDTLLNGKNGVDGKSFAELLATIIKITSIDGSQITLQAFVQNVENKIANLESITNTLSSTKQNKLTSSDGSILFNQDDAIVNRTILSSINTITDNQGKVISNIGTPINNKDATTKEYVDQAVTGVTPAVLGAVIQNNLTPSSTKAPSVDAVNSALALKADDTLVLHKAGAETVTGVKTFSVVPKSTLAPSAIDDLANKAYVDGLVASGVADATTTLKGKIQLAGDLAGTATAPTVPGLITKEPAFTVLPVSKGGTGLSTAGAALQLLRVNAAGNALEYFTSPASSAGTVTSVNISGGTTGLTSTGGPITTTGTMTLGGTLAVANGGTGTTTLTTLKTNLVITKSDVGLANVDNTSDINKPVSTAQLTALNLKTDKTITITGTTSLTGGGDLSANRTISLSGDVAVPGNSQYYGTNGTGTKGYFALPASTGGTITSISTGTGLSGGPITTSGTLALANMAANTLKGAVVAGAPQDLTPTQAKSVLALTKSDVGLASVDNTSDLNKPISTAQQTALNLKADDTNVVHKTLTETITGDKTFSGNVTLGDTTADTITVNGVIDSPNATPHKLRFEYANQAAFPSAAVYHGAIAHSHADNALFFAHSGAWTRLQDQGTTITASQGGTGLTTYTTGDTLFASATNTLAKLPIGTAGQFLTVAGGVPSWATVTPASGPWSAVSGATTTLDPSAGIALLNSTNNATNTGKTQLIVENSTIGANPATAEVFVSGADKANLVLSANTNGAQNEIQYLIDGSQTTFNIVQSGGSGSATSSIFSSFAGFAFRTGRDFNYPGGISTYPNVLSIEEADLTNNGNVVLTNGNDLVLKGRSAFPNDSGDIVFGKNNYPATGAELGRIYAESTTSTLNLSANSTAGDTQYMLRLNSAGAIIPGNNGAGIAGSVLTTEGAGASPIWSERGLQIDQAINASTAISGTLSSTVLTGGATLGGRTFPANTLKEGSTFILSFSLTHSTGIDIAIDRNIGLRFTNNAATQYVPFFTGYFPGFTNYNTGNSSAAITYSVNVTIVYVSGFFLVQGAVLASNNVNFPPTHILTNTSASVNPTFATDMRVSTNSANSSTILGSVRMIKIA
jgi:hypothetical protein